jgi:hypothetical protein
MRIRRTEVVVETERILVARRPVGPKLWCPKCKEPIVIESDATKTSFSVESESHRIMTTEDGLKLLCLNWQGVSG